MPPQNTRRFTFDMAAQVALIASLALAAIIIPWGSLPFIATKTFVLAAGAIITLALWILARLSRGNVIVPPALMLGVLVLPFVAYALSAAFSGTNAMSALFGTALDSSSVSFILVVTVLGLMSALIIRRPADWRRFFAWSGYVLAALVAVSVLALLIGQAAPSLISPAFSLVGSYIDLAALAGLGLVLGLIAMRSIEFKPIHQTLLYVLGAGELVILALANNTFAWVTVALVALALFVEAVMQRRSSGDVIEIDLDDAEIVIEDESAAPQQRSLAAPLVVLAVALFFLIGSSLGNALASAMKVNVLDVRPSWQSTLATGSASYHDSAFFGTGPGTFGAEWLKSRSPSLNSTIFWNVDFTSGIGYLPTSFAETGIAGIIAWLLLLGSLLFFGIRMLIVRAPEDEFMRFAALASFAGAVYLFALMLFAAPSPLLIALAFVFAGLAISSLRYARGAAQWGIAFSRSPRLGFAIVFALTLVLLGSIGAAYATTERYLGAVELSKAQAALNAGSIAAASSAVASSISFAPTPLAYQTQAVIANAQLNQIASDSALAPADAQRQFQAALSGGINAGLTATRLAPESYQNWLALGNLYASVVPLNVAGAYDNAKNAYQKAMALSPSSPTIPYLVAELDIAHKNNPAAIEDLKQAITLKQDYTQAIILLSQLEVAAGNVKDALAAAEAAAYFTPNDSSVLFEVGILRAASGDNDGAIGALTAAVAANPQFANARYFLAAVYAKKGDYADATTQLQAIAGLSDANKQAVESAIAQLQASKNPFPANLLSATSTIPAN